MISGEKQVNEEKEEPSGGGERGVVKRKRSSEEEGLESWLLEVIELCRQW